MLAPETSRAWENKREASIIRAKVCKGTPVGYSQTSTKEYPVD